MLKALAEGERFHRFKAERRLHDHCLHSTISALERRGLRIARRWITVRGFQGFDTRVVLYWLEPDQRQYAWTLLGMDQEGRQ
nr:helix-turn-helix domain-containing protein [Thioalkalivibrio sp. ALE9]